MTVALETSSSKSKTSGRTSAQLPDPSAPVLIHPHHDHGTPHRPAHVTCCIFAEAA